MAWEAGQAGSALNRPLEKHSRVPSVPRTSVHPSRMLTASPLHPTIHPTVPWDPVLVPAAFLP